MSDRKWKDMTFERIMCIFWVGCSAYTFMFGNGTQIENISLAMDSMSMAGIFYIINEVKKKK